MTVTVHECEDRQTVLAILHDPSFIVPPTRPDVPVGGIGWLRASVARFAAGPTHDRLRELTVSLLENVDPEELAQRAETHARTILDAATGRVDIMADIARHVPLTVLATALGVRQVDVAAVRVAAAAYPLDTADAEADTAVAKLIGQFGGRADEETAARIGLLIQACEGTAGLIGKAALRYLDQMPVDAGSAVAETMAQDPPVRATRRQATAIAVVGGRTVEAGDIIRLKLTGRKQEATAALGFGAGIHACPGSRHAVALAAGILQALRGRRLEATDVHYEGSPNLSIPTKLEVGP